MPTKKKARKPNGASNPNSKPKVKPSAKKKARKPNSAPHPYKPKVKPRPRTKRPKPSRNDIIVQALGVQTPLERFFSRYPYFKCQPLNPPVVEFNRLCDTYGWERGDAERDAARKAFQHAMKMEFNDLYGSDEKDINNWRKLCHVLRINPVPDTLWKCRSAVLNKHVNLVDLVHGSKEEVRIFKTEQELSEYTKETEKYFPKAAANDGGVLRALRRHILAPREGISFSRRNEGLKRK